MFLSEAPTIESSAVIFATFIFSKSVPQIFKIVFLPGDTDIFVFRCNASVLYFQIKSSFSRKNTPTVESETHF